MPPSKNTNDDPLQHGKDVLKERRAAFKEPKTPLGQWHGRKLLEETRRRVMLISDLQGDQGVEGSYDRSTITNSTILDLLSGNVENVQNAFQNGGGFSNEYRIPPFNPRHPDAKQHSELEFFENGLSMQSKNTWQFRGSVLSPIGAEFYKVLSAATWEESFTPGKIGDEYTDRVAQTVGSQIKLDDDDSCDSLLKIAHEILMFYALDQDTPNASQIHFNDLLQEWKNGPYKYVILWRNKMMKVVGVKNEGELLLPEEIDEELSPKVPMGDNDASGNFFKKNGMAEFATEQDHNLVVRDIEGKRYFIRIIRSWMIGEICKMAEKSKVRYEKIRSKYIS